MKVLLLTGTLVICFTPLVFSHGDDLVLELCKQNITNINRNSDVLENARLEIWHLNLCDNDLLTINGDAFQRFENLEYLNLNGNSRIKFNADGSEFLMLESLTDLQCVRCGVDKIYNKSLQGLPQLELINLTQNGIEEIEVKAFYANTKLEKIYLRSNKLSQVPSKMLTWLVNIKWIDLSLNTKLAPVGSEPFLISTVLEKLSCDECGFVTVQESTFAKLPGLKELYLQRNKISKINGLAFSQMTLTTLMLEGNVLKSIDPKILNVEDFKICLGNNTDELECFLKDLSYQDKFNCSSNLREDVDCLALTTIEIDTTTIEIHTTSTIDFTNSTTDVTIISVDEPIKTTNLPDINAKSETHSTSNPSTPSFEIVEGISDAYIGGYLTVIYLAQIGTFVLLVGVWLKLKKYDTDPDVDRYAETILNPSPIYKAVY